MHQVGISKLAKVGKLGLKDYMTCAISKQSNIKRATFSYE
ncbi:MAG: hypothetical protein ACI86M_001113 [Saprospiraceae bacterium]|jgi:hypothetical protein